MKREFILQKMRLLLVLALFFCISTQSHAQWKTLRTGGGGCIPSMVAHPKVQGLYFITTDVGTPYRWNSLTQAWEGLFYNLPVDYWQNNAAGNIAVDPSDATGNVVYATIGSSSTTIDGGLLKSIDRGTTWIDCHLPLNIRPNNDQHYGQRLAVDPNNSNIVYVTTRPSTTGVSATNGTFKSTDAGATWTKINELCGSFLTFDVSGGVASGITKNIFIGCADGVYQSTNGGTDFSLMAGSPTNSSRVGIHSNGTMYITHYKSVAKWNGTGWSDITPPSVYAYSAIAVNPNNSDQLIVGQGDQAAYKFAQYVSKDGGATWILVTPVADLSEIPWFSSTIGQGLTGFCWDPFDQNMVWFTDYFNPQQTTNIWAGSSVTWKARGTGEEETCATGNMLCPPSGVNLLLTNVADVGGFDHKSLTSPPTIGMMTHFPWSWSGQAGNMTGVAVQESNPNFIARVGRHGWNGLGFAGYSTNGGSSYTYWNCPTGASGGRIAVSATSETLVWVPQGGSCYQSTNRGTTWTAITTLPTGVIGGANVFSSGPVFPVAADKVNGNKFYVYCAGRMYVSTDGGSSFLPGAALSNPWYTNPLALETTPGKEGDLWIALSDYGLHHSTNSGSTFSAIPNVQIAYSVSIGMASPNSPTVPAIYVYGTVNNIPNTLFRSNDNGTTWQIVSSPVHTGDDVYGMAADRQVYGRVFFGTSGNGTVYIEDVPDTQAPTTPTNLVSASTTTTSLRLIWNPSSDNVAVSYDIYQDGVLKGNSNVATYTLSNLIANKTYAITVKAKDIAGNVSAPCSANFTTLAAEVVAENVALGKSVTGNGTASTLALGNDGKLNTLWGSGGTLPFWYDIDLGNSYNITGVEVFWCHTDWIYKYKIEVSNDNSVWVMASDKTSNTYSGAPSELNNFTVNGYRYIKFTITGWGTSGAYSGSAYEFKVFGTLAPTGMNERSTTNVKIYPNPVTNNLGIENLNMNADITITTLNGITVYSNRITSPEKLTISVANWVKGMYLIRVKDDTGICTQRIFVQ